ncbi:MAG: FHA domain-containing protein, partial [Aquiluna sp.]
IRVGSQPVDTSVAWRPVLTIGDKEYELKVGTSTVGRDEKADICVDDRGLSRIHFEIAWNGEVAAIRDLQSTNGTFLDGARVNELVLISGSTISAGRTEFHFQLLALAGESSE